jgi:hypothetical protein
MNTGDILLKRQSELLYEWLFTDNQFILVTSLLRFMTSIFSQLNTSVHSPYVTYSLTRGWVSRLQLLLGLASAVILRSESRWTHDHILLSQIRDSLNLDGQVPVFISVRNRVARLYPQALGSISSLPTTPTATVEVFDPAYTQDLLKRKTNKSIYETG